MTYDIPRPAHRRFADPSGGIISITVPLILIAREVIIFKRATQIIGHSKGFFIMNGYYSMCNTTVQCTRTRIWFIYKANSQGVQQSTLWGTLTRVADPHHFSTESDLTSKGCESATTEIYRAPLRLPFEPSRLHFEPLKLLKFCFNADPDPAYQIMQIHAYPDPQPWL
jgi:hypothetical protein